jgi:inner membrane protein
MDVLSQVVFGAAAGQAIAGHRLPRSAWLIGGLAGYLPDADVFIQPASDPLEGWLWHRWFTHGIGFVPIGALAVALPFLLAPALRRQRWWVIWAALAGIATHAPLDTATSFGTALLWPFSNARLGWDRVGIIDPLVTFPMIALVAVSVWRTWRGRHALASGMAPAADTQEQRPLIGGRRRGRWWHVGPAVAALVWAVVYIGGLGSWQRSRAMDAQATLAATRGHSITPGRARAMPQPLALLVWRTVYEHQGRVYTDIVRVPFVGPVSVIPGRGFPLVDAQTLITQSGLTGKHADAVRDFAEFADHYLSPSPEDSRIIGDMRYATDLEAFRPLWGLRLPMAPGGPVAMYRPGFGERSINAMWQMLTGDHPDLLPLLGVQNGQGSGRGTAPTDAGP